MNPINRLSQLFFAAAAILALAAPMATASTDAEVRRGVTLAVGNLAATAEGAYQVVLTLVPQGGQPMTDTIPVQAAAGASIAAGKRFDVAAEQFIWKVEVSSGGRRVLALEGNHPAPSQTFPYTRVEPPAADRLRVRDLNKPIVTISLARFRAVGDLNAPLKTIRQGQYRMQVWVDANVDGARQSEEATDGPGVPKDGVLTLRSGEISSWTREARFSMEMRDPDEVPLVRITGTWDFESQLPRGLDPWFDRNRVREVDFRFATIKGEEEVLLENPFKGTASVSPGQEQRGGTRVRLEPVGGDDDTPSRETYPNATALPKTATLVVRVNREGSKQPVLGAQAQVEGPDGVLASDAVDTDGQVRFYITVPTDREADFAVRINAEDYKPGEFRVSLTAGQVMEREVLLAPVSPTIGDRTSGVLGGITPWLKYLIPATIAVIALWVALPRLRRLFA